MLKSTVLVFFVFFISLKMSEATPATITPKKCAVETFFLRINSANENLNVTRRVDPLDNCEKDKLCLSTRTPDMKILIEHGSYCMDMATGIKDKNCMCDASVYKVEERCGNIHRVEKWKDQEQTENYCVCPHKHTCVKSSADYVSSRKYNSYCFPNPEL